MGWIKVDDQFAEEATPDPRKILDAIRFQEEIVRKQREVEMYANEITNLTERKSSIEAEIVEMQALLEA
jgi:hypothetical protein